MSGMTWRNPDRRFLLHHTHEGRLGLCASDDPNPPPAGKVVASLTHGDLFALLDDADETLVDCIRRDGVEEGD